MEKDRSDEFGRSATLGDDDTALAGGGLVQSYTSDGLDEMIPETRCGSASSHQILMPPHQSDVLEHIPAATDETCTTRTSSTRPTHRIRPQRMRL